MDKISAVLILGIIVLMMTNGIIIYETWLSDEAQSIEAETIIQDMQTGEEDLSFNDDTSVKNNSCRKLWIRAKLVYNDQCDPNGYSIISGAMENGLWQRDEEGWYYYSKPVGFAQTTEPLIDRLLYNGKEVSRERGSFSMQVEAVDDEWFVSKPSDCTEAFEFFQETIAIPCRAYL